MYILYKMSRLVSQIQFLDLKHVSLNSLSSSFMPIEHDISFPCLNAPPAFTSNSAPIVKWSWLIQFSIFFLCFSLKQLNCQLPRLVQVLQPGASNQLVTRLQTCSKLTFKERFIIQIFQKSETSRSNRSPNRKFKHANS